uniref:Transcription elongation factor Eaf N-terminal domain-containing protein n=1 Tax=Bionectria ochroleuca TaxID=29856 RepID=A0A0B7K2Z7_BIOOC
MAELVDPTQKGNYPVILGDSLLGKNSNEIFTGVRYNHKPPIATAEKNPARLKPSVSGDKSSYDLNFVDKVGHTEYAYAGARNTDDGQYEEEEEDDDDDDGGLLVEYPGGEPRSQKRDFSPAFPAVRRFDDFMDQRESEADDADGESEDEGDVDFKLPSPVNHHQNTYGGQMEEEEESEPEMEEVEPRAPEYEQEDSLDIEDDLEKDLEMAFEEVNVEDKGEESEISEED